MCPHTSLFGPVVNCGAAGLSKLSGDTMPGSSRKPQTRCAGRVNRALSVCCVYAGTFTTTRPSVHPREECGYAELPTSTSTNNNERTTARTNARTSGTSESSSSLCCCREFIKTTKRRLPHAVVEQEHCVVQCSCLLVRRATNEPTTRRAPSPSHSRFERARSSSSSSSLLLLAVLFRARNARRRHFIHQ